MSYCLRICVVYLSVCVRVFARAQMRMSFYYTFFHSSFFLFHTCNPDLLTVSEFYSWNAIQIYGKIYVWRVDA